MNNFQNIVIKADNSIKNTLKKMDFEGFKLLIVEYKDKFQGLISIGDLQRAIIQDRKMNTPISEILRKDIIVGSYLESKQEIKNKMLSIRAEFMPILNDKNEVEDVVFWEDLFDVKKPPTAKFQLPVVIMAGGFGTRLKPLTNIIPKPLIPIGQKTMLEQIFDRFAHYGCNEFHISVNYKADLIEYYLKSQNLSHDISYFEEDKPMGTAGSLSLLKGKIGDTFFVSNCDILIENDYSEILNYHRQRENEITVVAALKHFKIPYGTIETGTDGRLESLIEKPELTFKINSGMYVLEPHLIDEVPNNEFYHITQLIEKLRTEGRKVGVYPVSEKSWIDIGNWQEYMSLIGK